MKFNADGSLQVSKKVVRDHITLFHLLLELPFPVGKKLLIQLLRGELNERIKKLSLDKVVHHGSLGGYEEEELSSFIDALLQKGFLTVDIKKDKYRVLELSPLGYQEFEKQELSLKVDDFASSLHTSLPKLPESYVVAPITNEDKAVFSELDFFLKEFTDEQKKAIICMDTRQVCIAGAGSGKTSVLTNKIAFLVKYAGISKKDILAITFTRKARQEMISRLEKLLPNKTIRVETFNSFAEKELQKYGSLLYGKDKVMVSHQEFLSLVVDKLSELGFSVETFLDHYFEPKERRNKDSRQLLFSFLYDFRAILDAYIRHGKQEDYFRNRLTDAVLSKKITAENVAKLVSLVATTLEERGLRTYADQLVDCNMLFESFPDVKQDFSWVLVDEYQDVNEEQCRLLDNLLPKHLFVVGDPRQSIYSWRGANPDTMYTFMKTRPVTIMELTTNFRSAKKVVSFANALISQTSNGKNVFSPLHSGTVEQGVVSVTHYKDDVAEAKAIVTTILALEISRNEIFVLSRTNKGLDAVADACKNQGISFVMRTEESIHDSSGKEIVLATVHAIKGLEAEVVFVVGASGFNYPCRAKDHHFVELFAKKESYDVYEEERRILYVAITRAKRLLQVSYVGVPSPFLASKVLISADVKLAGTSSVQESSQERLLKQKASLRRWRFLESKERNIPPYLIFSDKVLEQVLQLQPVSLEDLELIKGFGKTKITEFGLDLLHVLQQ